MDSKNFSQMRHLPELKTDRLLLTAPKARDISRIIEYAGDPMIAAMTMNIPHPYAEEDAIFWLNHSHQGLTAGTQYTFAIRLQDTKQFIGGMGLKVNQSFNHAEAGYWLARPYWGQGLTTEALGAVLTFGFEQLGLNKIFATHLVENPASGKVMIKNGMIKEAELKEHFKKGDTYKSIIQYRLTKEEFTFLNLPRKR